MLWDKIKTKTHAQDHEPADEIAGPAVLDEDISADEGISADQEYPLVRDEASGEEYPIRGTVLSAEGGALGSDVKTRDICALIGDGTFFVSRSDIHNPRIASLRARAEQLGHRVETTVHVDLATLKQVYQIAARQQSGAYAKVRDHHEESRMHRDLLSMIKYAAKVGASDIHIVANQNSAAVRLRVDGILVDYRELSPAYAFRLCSASHSLCDSSDASYQPYEFQGARISSLTADLPKNIQSVRMQWNPLVFDGRFLAIRLLPRNDEDDQHLDLDSLGYARHHLQQIKYMRSRPIGMNVFSGPTGSGKSTTLQRALSILIRERGNEINVLTVEDPPEFVIPDAQQMPVTNAQSADQRTEKFRQAIVAALRSDPDVIMIGEIRDAYSAKLAFEGAMTGHQIWTSIHTNSAVNIIDRLADMGVEPYKVFDPTYVTGLVGQRLLRLLCPHCRVLFAEAVAQGKADDETLLRATTLLARLGRTDIDLWSRGPGCDHCQRGYVGRTVAAETIIPDDDFMGLLRAGEKTAARAYWLSSLKGASMVAHAASKMIAGLTGPTEVENAVALLEFDDHAVGSLERFIKE